MRVSVWYSTGKILILCRDGTNTVDWVISEFSKKLERRMHLPPGSVKVKWLELTAASDVQKNHGEAKLQPSQVIRDVVEDGGDLITITEGPETGKSVIGNTNEEETSVNKSESASEPTKICVQCGAEYRESENAMGVCRFHQVPPRKHLWGYVYDCCDQEEGPCKVGQHRSEHHADYPYEHYKAWEDSVVGEIQANWTTLSRADYACGGTIRTFMVDRLSGPRCLVRVLCDSKTRYVKVVDDSSECVCEWSDGTSFSMRVCFCSVPNGRQINIRFMINFDTFERVLVYSVAGKLVSVSEKLTPERVQWKPAQCPASHNIGSAYHRTGKSFDSLEMPSVVPTESESIPDSTSKISVRWKGPVLADQDTFAKDGQLGQYFIANFELTNNSNTEDITISSITCRIANDEYNTTASTYCFSYVGVLNTKTGKYYFPEDGGLPFTLPAHTTSSIAVSSKFFVHGKPAKTEATQKRAHLSLPHPLLRLEHSFHSNSNSDGALLCSPVVAVYSNPPLAPITQEAFAAEHPELRVLHWLHCDDFSDALRKWFALCAGPLGELVAWTEAASTVFSDSLWAWAAADNVSGGGGAAADCKAVRVPLFGDGTDVFALKYGDSGAVWGLRVALHTDSGSAVDEFQIPDVAEMRAPLRVAVEKEDDGHYRVSWNILAASQRVKVCSQECETGYGNAAESVVVTSPQGSVLFSHPYIYVYNEDTIKYDSTAILKAQAMN